jgi:DNA polymerase V
MEKQFIAIDLKSFYASVECVARGLDPLNTNLVVADPERTSKTICLAVSPTLKRHGIPGRARLFEVQQKLTVANAERKEKAPGKVFKGKSVFGTDLDSDPSLEIDFIQAPPRMSLYMKYSTDILNIYLKYIAPEDIHVYSVDEVFMDVTAYLNTYRMTAHELAMTMVREVLQTTGITATAGIGTNLYLCKIAMDIVAKHMPADKDGVRVAELDEMSYRRLLWNHKPLTDFWRVGSGISKKLAKYGMYTMGDVARCSVGKPTDYYNEALLYRLFGINAELLIDHAWGWEPVGMKEIKAFRPSTNSVSIGQVLKEPYDYERTRLIIKEMTDLLVLDLVKKGVVTDQLVLNIGFDTENLYDTEKMKHFKGEVVYDHYGRPVPKGIHGSINLPEYTSSTTVIMEYMMRLYDRIAEKDLTTRRMNVVANHVISEKKAEKLERESEDYTQLELFTDYEEQERERAAKKEKRQREKNVQKAIIEIKEKFGKNAVLKGMNLEEGGTTIERNRQIGGHKAE